MQASHRIVETRSRGSNAATRLRDDVHSARGTCTGTKCLSISLSCPVGCLWVRIGRVGAGRR